MWRRLRCAAVEAFERDVPFKQWEGARMATYTDYRNQPAQEAVKEGRLAPVNIEELICLANDVWGAGKWGDPPRFDPHGAIIEPDRIPSPATPHGFSVVLLKDGDTTRTLGMYYYPSVVNADGKLSQPVSEAMAAAAAY